MLSPLLSVTLPAVRRVSSSTAAMTVKKSPPLGSPCLGGKFRREVLERAVGEHEHERRG